MELGRRVVNGFEGVFGTMQELIENVCNIHLRNRMKVFAIDPGTIESAWAIWDGAAIHSFRKEPNEDLISRLTQLPYPLSDNCHVVIEQVRSYGMAVGANIFDTVHWSGRFHQAAHERGLPVSLVPRIKVQMHMCHRSTAGDSNISQALKDRFAYGVRNHGKGTKKEPGFFHGFADDIWQAFALAVTVWDKEHG